MGLLTVRETFLFASKLINFEDQNFDHNGVADKLISRFGLNPIANTKAKKCSGGQQKRLSIALEVLSRPNILILDEPTTGLDSPSCRQIMAIMQELVSDKSNPIAVVATIHQPSVKIFNSFHRAYVLSAMGECIYNGNFILCLVSSLPSRHPSILKTGDRLCERVPTDLTWGFTLRDYSTSLVMNKQ